MPVNNRLSYSIEIEQVNRLLEPIVLGTKNAVFIDAYSKFSAKTHSRRDITDLYLPDGVHLTGVGYKLLCEVLDEFILQD